MYQWAADAGEVAAISLGSGPALPLGNRDPSMRSLLSDECEECR
jgi:hypothetical protein